MKIMNFPTPKEKIIGNIKRQTPRSRWIDKFCKKAEKMSLLVCSISKTKKT